jgi:hypothetical protein
VHGHPGLVGGARVLVDAPSPVPPPAPPSARRRLVPLLAPGREPRREGVGVTPTHANAKPSERWLAVQSAEFTLEGVPLVTVPSRLGVGGRRLWRAITADHHDLDPHQLLTLECACIAIDRCDMLAPQAAAGDSWAIREERAQTLHVSQMLGALRLPDSVTGRRPQRRGGPRAPQRPR